MNYQEYINKNKDIQSKLLLFLDKEDCIEENYQNLLKLITSYKIIDNSHELRSFLYLISNICNNHYRTPSFISKIERLFESLKESLKNNFTNQKIFEIFKKSKTILLFLIEREIIRFDQSIMNLITSTKYFKRSYHLFFFPEVQKINEKGEFNIKIDSTNLYQKFSKQLPDNFLKQRKIGQNENDICKLIREDSIDEFITNVNQHDYSLNSNIEQSIYETNSFLMKNEPTLIEYAAFFGSTQIFKYLYKNGVELKSSLWLYGIHSDNAEIIQLLEENKVEPPNESYEKCIKESIKCHHNDITNYILSNFIKEDIENINQINFEKKYKENIYSYCFHYYNFAYFPKEIEQQIIFYYACQYDYIDIVEYFLKMKQFDVKAKIIITNIFNQILNQIFFIIFHH